MKIITFKRGSIASKALMMLIVVMSTTFGVLAQTGGAPKVSHYYPAADEDEPATVHENTSMYIYFDGVISKCDALVLQNDKEIGKLTFVGKSPANALPAKKDMLLALLDGSKLQKGTFVIKPVSVTYINAAGEEVDYEDTDGEWPTATYYFGGEAGKVVSETELPNKTVKSWYPADSNEGTKTITFNKAIKPDVMAVLEYGNGESTNNFARIPVPCTLSDDGKSLTIDLRGRVHSVNTMVPNAHFVDENGTPVPPPTVIALAVSDLYTEEGQPVIGIYEDAATGSQLRITAGLYYSYNFKDLTFTTPKITSVKFEGDNLLITLADMQNLVSADVTLMGENGVVGSVANVDITGSTVSVKVPAGVNVENVVSVALENAVYNAVDGVEHIIRPFNINGTTSSIELSSIAGIKALNNKDKFRLKCDDVKVTYSNTQEGFIFIEDASGAVQVDAECGFAPSESTILTGTLEGSYLGEGLISIDTVHSEYEANAATIEPTELTLGEITFPINNYRLVKISLEDVNCEFSDEDNVYYLTMENLDTPVLVVIDLIGDGMYEAPRNVKEITGIVYCQPFMGEYMIVVRHKDDIVEGGTSAIRDIANEGDSDAPVYTVGGVKVRNAGESLDGLSNGVYVIGGKKVMVK